jgi:hypothetical protein
MLLPEFPSPIEIKMSLQMLGKSQAYLAKLFNRPPSQISNAINTDLYPALKKKILRHIIKLEAKNGTINQTD